MAGKPTPFDAVHSVLKDRTFEESDADRVAALEGKPKNKKLSNWDTFVAVAKAYCAINVLLLPCSFKNGGYIIAPVAMVVACFFESLCAARLTSVANKFQIFSYPLIMKKAMGNKGLQTARILLALAHWQFTIGQVSFTLESLQSTVMAWTGNEVPLIVFGLIIWLIYSPLVWVRTLEYFKRAFAFAMLMIALGVVTTSWFAGEQIVANDGKPGAGFEPVNRESYFAMIGFAFFMFEGIGCLLPVMRETEHPENLGKITVLCLVTLCTVYMAFSMFCYYAWGASLDEPVVTEMLPADNTFVQTMKLLYCINLVFSFPITIVPTFNTLEAVIFG